MHIFYINMSMCFLGALCCRKNHQVCSAVLLQNDDKNYKQTAVSQVTTFRCNNNAHIVQVQTPQVCLIGAALVGRRV